MLYGSGIKYTPKIAANSVYMSISSIVSGAGLQAVHCKLLPAHHASWMQRVLPSPNPFVLINHEFSIILSRLNCCWAAWLAGERHKLCNCPQLITLIQQMYSYKSFSKNWIDKKALTWKYLSEKRPPLLGIWLFYLSEGFFWLHLDIYEWSQEENAGRCCQNITQTGTHYFCYSTQHTDVQ